MLRGVDQWPIHSAIIERIKEKKHQLFYSVQVSFFHSPTKSFFGDTWRSTAVPEPSLKRDRSGGSSFRCSDVTMNEVVYWYSYIDDPRTFVVVELVAIERDQKHGIEVF